MATVNRQRISNAAGGLGDPLQNLAPQPIVSVRNPATSDVAEIGTIWINKATDAYFILTSVVSNAAVWQAQSTGSGVFASVQVTGGAGTVLTVDAGGDTDLGGALAVAGNTTMSGDLAVTGNVTVTGDFDITDTSAISLTSTADVSDAIYLHANGGTSETIRLHSDQGTGVGSVTLLSDVGGLTLRSAAFASADAINIEAADAAGGIDIDAGTGGIAIDTTGGFSIDGATASNVTVTGAAQDLTLSAAGGSVNITATQSAADSIVINSTTGGIDILASGAAAGEDIDIIATGSSVNLESTEDAALAIYLHANGGTSETIRLRSDLGTGVNSIDILSDVGGITLTSGLASADAINLAASAGGVDVDGALQVNIASSQAAADAVRILASDAAGGIDVDAGTGGMNFTTANGAIAVVSGTAAISVSADAAATTLNIGTGAAVVKTINVGGTGANVIAIGNTQTGGSVSIGAAMTTGTISIGAATSGLVAMPAVSVSAAGSTVVNNVRVGQAIYTGLTTAAAADEVLTLTNSLISATSSIFLTVSNLGAADAQMTISRILPGAGTCAITLTNNGAAALNGNIQVSFWIN